LMTANSLRLYATQRVLPQLPIHHVDEVGALMADAVQTLGQFDTTIDHLGNYDALTALPNRKWLLRTLGERHADGAAHALCVMKLRNLDAIQSAYGQEAGNAVLRRLSISLGHAVGPQALLARVDGPRFAFVMNSHQSVEDLAARLLRIHAAMPTESHFQGVNMAPELVIGVALYPSDAGTAEDLVNNAILAASATAAGKNGNTPVGFYSVQSRDQVRQRFTMEQDLRRALERDELALHYQPVIDLQAGRITGAEALLRWKHPERGMVPPAEFIPVAEQCGLIDMLGLWVLQTACRQVRQWTDTELGDMRLAINLSASQFLDPDIVAKIDHALRGNGLSPSRLEIELTETAAMTDAKRTHRTLEALRRMGVRTAIDDFGTGYSSLSYLKTLPFDKIKIDRAFVTGVERSRTSAAICRSIIELAHGLDITVIAEGAERHEEVNFLSSMGCGLFQGYYFSRPVTASVLEQLVGDGRLAESMSGFQVGDNAHTWPVFSPMSAPAKLH
jgi:diguanylate cyclase (GGDEF)-like protein